MIFYCCQSPALFISPMPSLSAVSALSNRSVFHKDCSAPCRVVSCAPTAPALPSGNPALSSYISRSDCGLYYCFPLSAHRTQETRSQSTYINAQCKNSRITRFLLILHPVFSAKLQDENVRYKKPSFMTHSFSCSTSPESSLLSGLTGFALRTAIGYNHNISQK